MIGSRGVPERSRATLSPFSGSRCRVWIRFDLYPLPTPLLGPGLWYPCGNAQFEEFLCFRFESWRSWFLGTTHHMHHRGVRVREQWELVTPLVLSEAG